MSPRPSPAPSPATARRRLRPSLVRPRALTAPSGVAPTATPIRPLPLGDQLQAGERRAQLPGCGPKPSCGAADLTQRADRQQSARSQPLQHRRVEPTVAEPGAVNDIGRRPVRQAVVEVDDVESAPVADAAAQGERPRLLDDDRRDVQPGHLQAPLGQPDRRGTLAAGDVERVAGDRERVREGHKHRSGSDRVRCRHVAARVFRIPAGAVLGAHRNGRYCGGEITPPIALLLFVLGGAAGLIGDHSHVVTGTTEYLSPSQAVPFIWSSPLYFPILVGSATVFLAELRLHLPRRVPRSRCVRGGWSGRGAGQLRRHRDAACLAGGSPHDADLRVRCDHFLRLGRSSGDCLRRADRGRRPGGRDRDRRDRPLPLYPGSDGLFGVAPWLVPLYFAFGVVAALIGEIAAGVTRPVT